MSDPSFRADPISLRAAHPTRLSHPGRWLALPGLILLLAIILSGTETPCRSAAAGQNLSSFFAPDTPPIRLSYDGLPAAPRLPGEMTRQAGPQTAPAQGYASWSRLVFQSARNQNDWEIYSANGDGSNQVNLTNHGAMDIHPRLNRGATQVVFVSKRDGNYEIYVMNTDGSGQTRLTTTGADDIYPAWSPDGGRIVFQSYRDGQAEVYVMNADGSGQTRLTFHDDYDGEPAWSPDSSRVAFVRRASGLYRIWVMNADGSNPVQFSNQPYSENPVWSPDGSHIAYDADGNGDGWQELWLMDAAGGNQRMAYWPGGANTDAWARSWSPDGRYIAFTRISFIQQGGTWYWTTAYLDAWDSSQPGNLPLRLSSAGKDWHPDWQSFDLQPPVSSVQPLPAQSPAAFNVSWSGVDIGPAGLASYDIQIRDGLTGPWSDWQMSTTNQTAAYIGIGGHTYCFRARARDHAANVEPWPADNDACTTVEALPPVTAVQPLLEVSRAPELSIRWRGSDPGGSGIQNYDVQVRQNTGDWTDWLSGVTATVAPFNGQGGVTYDFRVRARDRAQNVEAWPVGGGDATTTFYTWLISGRATDNRGAPVTDMAAGTTPAAFRTMSSDGAGIYTTYVAAEADSYTVTWNKAAYGALPGTIFSSAYDPEKDVVLPPTDNVIQDWGFENGVLTQQFSNAAWQFGGSLTGTITNAIRHSGVAAAFIGAKADPLRSVITLTESLRNFNPPVDSVMDSAGVLHCAWLEPDGRVMYSSKSPASVWATATPLPGPLAHYGGSVKLFADNTGAIHAIWIGEDALYYSQKRPGLGWSAPENIPGTISTWIAPGVAIGKTGIVKLVYVGVGSSGVGYGDAYFTERRLDGVWTSPKNISDTYGPDEWFRMVIDPLDRLHVLWIASDTSGLQDIFYAAETDDGSWLPAVNLSEYDNHVGDADMVVDSNNVVYVAWSADRTYYRSRARNESWSPKQLISSANNGGVSLFADARDRIHLAWGDFATSQLYYAVRSAGGWSSPVAVAPPAVNRPQSTPRLVLEKNGTIHLLWLQYQDINDWSIHYSIQNDVGQWSAPAELFRHDHDTSRPKFFVDPFGTPHAIWAAYLNGNYVAMYAGPESWGISGDATLAQAVRVPDAALAPTLSFLHRFGTEFSSKSHLEVIVDDEFASTTVFSTSTTANTWQHQWADLTPWAGRPVTITFKVVEVAGGARAWAYIDEVSVGAARPDGWVGLTSPGAAPPGGEVMHTITYGNRGGVTGRNASITLQLPPQLTFVSADPPPSATTPGLRWDVGDLAGPSNPQTIRVTLRMAATAVRRTVVTTIATLVSDTAELEQANNTAQSTIFVGYLVRLPMVMR